MKSFLTFLLFIFISFGSIAQNAFDKRTHSAKKPDNGNKVGNAQTVFGKTNSTASIAGEFPVKYRLKKEFLNFDLEWDETGQCAISIIPKYIKKIETTNQSLGQYKLMEGVMIQLEEIKKLLQLNDPRKELLLTSYLEDELGFTHLKFQQLFEGIHVNGGQITVHVKENVIQSITNRLYPTSVLTNVNFMDPAAVVKIVLEDIPFIKLDPLGEEILGNKRITNQRVIVQFDRNSRKVTCCYKIEYRPNLLDWWEYFIEAGTGKIISKVNKTCSIDGPRTASASDLNAVNRTINTYQIGSNFYLLDASKSMFNSSASLLPNKGVGVIWTLDANFQSGSSLFNITSTNNSWSSKAGVSAHFNASVAFDYFKNVHGRNSINGNGGNVVSIVNVNDQNGNKLDNAYWNGEMMFYGNGNTAFTPLAGSLDVGGHEMTHGVVQNTANLEYKAQPGAINESMADVFGSLLDRNDWQIGEDITKTSYIPSGALRDLSDPHNGRNNLNQAGFQPKHMNEYYTGTQDNEGVHINSGIPNHAYFLIANSSVGKDKAEKIYYRALTVYLTSQSQFVDLRRAVIKSAEDLFGNGSSEASSAINAFNTVGIFGYNGTGGGGSTGNGNGEVILSANPGTESILSYNTDLGFVGTFYSTNTSGSSFVKKSETPAKRKASITDKGDLAYFVAEDDSRIKGFSLSGTPNESFVSAVGDEFDNVAISKDGKRMAAVTTLMDSSIYVYDFTLAKWTQFRLYNPTFSEGINTGGVLFADGLEWDYSGQFVVYDAKNLIEGSFGEDISWWDVGIIQVWDNVKNTWGDGTVKKLFNQLPENISIGNPTFAKNTGNIIAFDVIDTDDDTYSIFGKNTVTGKSDEITTATMIGYPNYSNKDDQLIYDAKNTSGTEVLAIIDLGADKITGSGSPSVLISDAKWGTWYAQGNRSLLSGAKDILNFGFPNLPGQPNGNFSGTTITIDLPAGTNVSQLVPTFTLSFLANGTISGVSQVSGVSAVNFSNPVVYTIKAEDGSTKNYTIRINFISGVKTISKSPIILYPNPAKDILNIEGPAKNYVLYDITGRELQRGDQKTIPIQTLNPGLYHLALEMLTGEIWRMSFVKE